MAGFQVVGFQGILHSSAAYLAPDGTMIAGDAFQTRGGLAVTGDLRITFSISSLGYVEPQTGFG